MFTVEDIAKQVASLKGLFHQPNYDVDNDAVSLGAEITSRATLELLNSK